MTCYFIISFFDCADATLRMTALQIISARQKRAEIILNPPYRRAVLASMHSVAWGTSIRRSFGMSLPVVLQMP